MAAAVNNARVKTNNNVLFMNPQFSLPNFCYVIRTETKSDKVIAV